MKKVVVGLFLSAFVAVGAFAQDQETGLNKRQHRGGHDMAQLNLTDQQKSQLKAIREEYHQKVQGVFTDEQKATLQKMKAEHKGKAGRKHHGFNSEKMKKELGLTDDQVTSLKKSRTETHGKIKALRADKSKTDEQKKAEIREFKKQQHESLKSILSPEQLQKLEQQRKSHGRKQPVQS